MPFGVILSSMLLWMNGVDQNYIPRTCEKITWDKTGLERTQSLRGSNAPETEAHLALLQKKYAILECTNKPKLFSNEKTRRLVNAAENNYLTETRKCSVIIKYLDEHSGDKDTCSSEVDQKLLQNLQQQRFDLNCDCPCAWNRPHKK